MKDFNALNHIFEEALLKEINQHGTEISFMADDIITD
jgi:hypothetical protein